MRPGEASCPRRRLAGGAGRASADARALAAFAQRGDRLHRRPGRGQPRRRAAGRSPPSSRGAIDIAGVELGGKFDRIDRMADGGLAIVDYKTGQPPKKKAVGAGYSLQLGLLGLIAERGGFPDIEGAAACFEYWSLARAPSGERAGQRGYVASPIGGRNGLDAAEFTALAASHFIAAAGKLADRRRAVHRQAAPGICALWRLRPADAARRMVWPRLSGTALRQGCARCRRRWSGSARRRP